MQIEFSKDGSQGCFRVTGDIDEARAKKLNSHFRQLDSSSVNNVTFDFGHVKLIGSAGIGKLLLSYKDPALSGGSLRIEMSPAAIYDLF